MSGVSYPDRNHYAQNRVLDRMQQRGEPMILRHVSLLAGQEGFKNPPDIVGAVTVTAGSTHTGQVYLGLTGPSIIGRLVPGDQIVIGPTTLTVVTMPVGVMTDTDGIPVVDLSGHPTFGSPPNYHADSLAWGNVLSVVPVSGIVDPAPLLGGVAAFVFHADQTVYGTTLSYYSMQQMGWVQVDGLGLSLAGKGITPEPKVNDVLLIDAADGRQMHSVVNVGRKFSNGVDFLFPVQAR